MTGQPTDGRSSATAVAEPQSLVLVPDVARGSGLGHLERCVALGEAWQAAGGTASVLVPGDRSEIIDRIVAAGLGAQRADGDPLASADLLEEGCADRSWCVVDGYGVGPDQLAAAAAAERVGVIVDHGRTDIGEADVVIDHNPGADSAPYLPTGALVLVGSRYTLLRSSHAVDESDICDERRERLVVVAGGSPDADTAVFFTEVLRRVRLPMSAVDVVGLPAMASIVGASLIDRNAALAPTFRRAGLALSAAGSTTWELAAAGTASVLLAVADNQEPVGDEAHRLGIARFLGRRMELSPTEVARDLDELWEDDATRERMGRAGRLLMDGRGPDRVVTAMLASGIHLREATVGDARCLWTWANDSRVRAMAFNHEPIPWSSHLTWLADRLHRPDSAIYLAESAVGEPWGQVRFDDVGGGAVEIGVSVDGRHRGRGLAGPLLVAASARLGRARPDVTVVRAKVKRINEASLRAFASAGFVEVDSTEEVHTLEREP